MCHLYVCLICAPYMYAYICLRAVHVYIQACVDSIMALIAKAAEAPDTYRLQPIETASPIRRTMPLRRQGNVRSAEGATRAPLKIYSEEQVKAMTENFSGRRRLGRGGCGQVFKGADDDGSEVAVKVLTIECLLLLIIECVLLPTIECELLLTIECVLLLP